MAANSRPTWPIFESWVSWSDREHFNQLSSDYKPTPTALAIHVKSHTIGAKLGCAPLSDGDRAPGAKQGVETAARP